MLRYALRRFYVAVIGLMLLTLPLFALMRVPLHDKSACNPEPATFCGGNEPKALMRDGPLYALWQTGLPPNDYWPIAVALLAAEGGATLVLVRRRDS